LCFSFEKLKGTKELPILARHWLGTDGGKLVPKIGLTESAETDPGLSEFVGPVQKLAFGTNTA